MAETPIETIIQKVQAHRKYHSINKDLVRRLTEDALNKGISGKSVVKAVRKKLHQVGGAYLNQNPDYSQLINTLSTLPRNIHAGDIKHFCTMAMSAHASSAERLPILETFFKTCLQSIAPIDSVLDLACGLNPLAVPWMPLSVNCSYTACDIYEDMLDLIHAFLTHLEIYNHIFSCDLAVCTPQKHVQVALLLKSIPCLEQLDKSISRRLLETLNTDHILVSFPVRSLGGKSKGMPDFYRQHFFEIIAGNCWDIQEFTFSTEMAFLISK